MMSNKVLIVANSAWYVRKFRGNLIRELLLCGRDVHVASPLGPDIAEIVELGVTHHVLDLDPSGTNLIKEICSLVSVFILLVGIRPSVIYSFTPKCNIYFGLANFILRFGFVPNVSGLGSSYIKGGFLRWLTILLYKVALKSARFVFFQNFDDSDLFLGLNIIPACKARVLPGSGVDLNYFRYIPILLKDDVVFLMVARVLADKGVREYCEAADCIKQFASHARFILVGEMGVSNPTALGREEIEFWVKRGAIEYLGYQDDLRSLYQSSDCVVLPSYREGMPRTLLEGGATGRPLIATDVPGCRQVVLPGINGFLCDAKSTLSLTVAMKDFLAMTFESRFEMGHQSRILVEQQYSEKIVLGIYLLESGCVKL